MSTLSEKLPYPKKYMEVHGSKMAYIDEGRGHPIVFMHGNPTSSYLWRNVMPHLAGRGRLIAADMIGMGDSDKLPDSGPEHYTFVEHRKYLFALLEALDVRENVTLVVHDWGSALGFHWAHQHQTAVRGIAFMEGIVAPVPTWAQFNDSARDTFQGLRSPMGESMVIDNNVFVENILPYSIIRKLTDAEMAEYRRPFAEPGEGRRPTLTWPRQIPIEGHPADVHAIVAAYSQWLPASPIPKLFVRAQPGALITGATVDFVRTWAHLTEVAVPGIHFIQEDAPHEIGQAIAQWLRG